MSIRSADDAVRDSSSASETMSSIQGADVAIRELGFYYEEDATVGTKISTIIQQRLNCRSKEGLDFYEANILNDGRIQHALNSFFLPSACSMALYDNFSKDPGHIFQYRRGGEEAGRRVLVVQLWNKGSGAVYYAHSHRHALPTANASNGLFEVPSAALEKAGCSEGTKVNFEQGGITIQDARTAFEITQGALNATVFATEDVFMKWPAMILPNTPDVRQKVAEIKGRLGLHARFTGEANKQSQAAPSPDSQPAG